MSKKNRDRRALKEREVRDPLLDQNVPIIGKGATKEELMVGSKVQGISPAEMMAQMSQRIVLEICETLGEAIDKNTKIMLSRIGILEVDVAAMKDQITELKERAGLV